MIESYWSPFGVSSTIRSSPSQRLFAYVCSHSDVGQTGRLKRVIRWLAHVCSFGAHDSAVKTLDNVPSLFYTTEMVRVLVSVLWNYGSNTSVCGELLEWRKELTIDLTR